MEITRLENGQGVIEDRLPRITELHRPPVANVDQVIIIMSFASPPPDLALLDRLLVLAEYEGIKAIVIFNKADLVSPPDEKSALPNLYSRINYHVLVTSAKTGYGLEEFKNILAGKVSVLAGPSGVGKSSLIQALQPTLSLKRAPVSPKSQRGRHTTRHVELLELDFGGLVADTPGFSRLDLPRMPREDLALFFPEITPLRNQCRFNSCLHYTEPGCAVREAVTQGLIDRGRYKHYVKFLEEVIAQERRFP